MCREEERIATTKRILPSIHNLRRLVMYEYHIQSGPLKITLVAETAYDAAVEAVRWWGRRTSQFANHRRNLEAEIQVRGAKVPRAFANDSPLLICS